MRQRGCHAGFTLIEVLIVVIIVSILAAVMIPGLSVSTNDAKQSALQHDLQTMQSQLQLYREDHLGTYPQISGNSLPQMTGATDASGRIGSAGAKFPHGPYVLEMPVNPFDSSQAVTAVAVPGEKPKAAVGQLGGWQYDASTGAVWPNNADYYSPAPVLEEASPATATAGREH